VTEEFLSTKRESERVLNKTSDGRCGVVHGPFHSNQMVYDGSRRSGNGGGLAVWGIT